MKRKDFNYGWVRNGKPVCLPDDAMIEEKREPMSPSGTAGAFFPGGVYEYKKRTKLYHR